MRRYLTLFLPFVFPVVMVAALFCSAGRWDLPLVWAYVAVFVVFIVTGHFMIDRGLRLERLHPGPGDKDKLSRRLTLPFMVAHWIIAGLDSGRFHWSDTVPLFLQVAGVVGLAVSLWIALWAVLVNPFFSPAVRIQHERGHHLITAGPYQWVRHPGYLAGLFSLLLGALALGSWWAMLPLGVYFLLILRRTALEDRFLQQELEGYRAYVKKVPYRLVPGIW